MLQHPPTLRPSPTTPSQAYENLGRIGEVRPACSRDSLCPAAACRRAAEPRAAGPLQPQPQGTFGTVLKCRNRETGEIVAIKKFKSRIDGENADAAQARLRGQP